MSYDEIIVKAITEKARDRADELGVKFKVKYSVKQGTENFLVRILRELPASAESLSEKELKDYKKQDEFAEFISKLIVPDYSYGVRFTYPSKL